MMTRTRYFVIASLLVLGIGIGTGLVAYYIGFPTSALSPPGGPSELQFVPRSASIVAFANVGEVMVSDARRRIRDASPLTTDGQREFETQTGINIETDIDRVVACLAPSINGDSVPPVSLLLARGRFDEARIEALMREHGAHVESYKGRRLIIADQAGGLSLAFLEPGLAAVGSTELVRHAIDLKDGGESVTTNDEMMKLVRSLGEGNVWAVGRFDALSAQAQLPAAVARQLPPIEWFSATGHVNGGIRAMLRAEVSDEQSAADLRGVLRGIVSLSRLQAGSRQSLQKLTQSLDIGGTGAMVSLSFDVPAELFDQLGKDLSTGAGATR